MKKILKLILLFSKKLMPELINYRLFRLELKIRYWYNPLLKNKISKIAKEDYLKVFTEQLDKKKHFEIIHYLHKAFNKHLIRSYLIDDQWWKEFVLLSTLREGANFNRVNQSLVSQIKTEKFNLLNHYEILHIYTLCLELSFFELAYHLRKKSVQIALRYSSFFKKEDVWKLKAKLSALLENNNFDEFDKLIKFFDKKWKKEKRSLSYFRNILKYNNNEINQNFIFNKNSKIDQKFKKFIENKKVIIVGPLNASLSDGHKINKAEIVIRTNYRRKFFKEDLVFKGSKCDITYLNGDVTDQIIRNKFYKWPQEISWIVCKSLNHVSLIKKKFLSSGFNLKKLDVRNLIDINDALFNGSLNALPNILIDILKYNPKDIMLYHFDLMLTINRVKGYTTNSVKLDKKKSQLIKLRLQGLAGHDPITQFIILKTFWSKGLIKGDINFVKIINMEAKGYMKSLQKNYPRLNIIDTQFNKI